MDKTPLGNEVLDFEPANLQQDLLAAIGLMAACGSHTEDIIEMAIAGMLGIDGEQGYAVTAHMPAPLRFSVLKASAEIRLTNAAALDELDILLERIKAAQGPRNDVIHASWGRRRSTGETLLVRQEARTHVEVISRPVAVDQIKAEAILLYEAGIGLLRFLIALDLMPNLPPNRARGVNTPKERKKRRKVQTQ